MQILIWIGRYIIWCLFFGISVSAFLYLVFVYMAWSVIFTQPNKSLRCSSWDENQGDMKQESLGHCGSEITNSIARLLADMSAQQLHASERRSGALREVICAVIPINLSPLCSKMPLPCFTFLLRHWVLHSLRSPKTNRKSWKEDSQMWPCTFILHVLIVLLQVTQSKGNSLSSCHEAINDYNFTTVLSRMCSLL